MSAPAQSRRHLHLVLEGYPAEKLAQVTPMPTSGETTEIVPLTPATAREALEKIFAADTIAVWGAL
jgi:hypothetical protein